MTQTFSVVPGAIFPGITDEERAILKVITNAYSDTRYKEGYEISKNDTAVVLNRAKIFLMKCNELYKNAISNNLIVEPSVEQFELLKETRF